jgi:hypothetical protein
MLATITAFLKALPPAVKLLGEIVSAIRYAADAKLERDVAEVNKKINTLTRQLETSGGEKHEVLAIIRELNTLKL